MKLFPVFQVICCVIFVAISFSLLLNPETWHPTYKTHNSSLSTEDDRHAASHYTYTVDRPVAALSPVEWPPVKQGNKVFSSEHGQRGGFSSLSACSVKFDPVCCRLPDTSNEAMRSDCVCAAVGGIASPLTDCVDGSSRAWLMQEGRTVFPSKCACHQNLERVHCDLRGVRVLVDNSCLCACVGGSVF